MGVIGDEVPGGQIPTEELTLKATGSLGVDRAGQRTNSRAAHRPNSPVSDGAIEAPDRLAQEKTRALRLISASMLASEGAVPQAPTTQSRRLDPDSASKLAVAQGPAVIAAATDVQVKAADLESARLVWRPTVSLVNVAIYGRGRSTSFQAVQRVDEPGVPAGFSKGDYMSNTLVVSFPIYYNATWYGGVTPLALQAEGSQEVAQETVALQAAAAANLAVKAYFNALLAREQYEIYKAEYSGKAKALEAVRRRVEVKEGLLADQLLIESSLAAARAGVDTTASLLTASLTQLRSLLGLPETEQLELTEVTNEITALPALSDLIANTVGDHPKVKSQLASVRIAKGALSQAQGNYGPTLAFSTSYTGASGFERAYPTFSSVGVTLTIPITDFGQSDAKIRSKALAVTQSEQQLESIRSSTIRDLASAHHAALQATAQILPAVAKLKQLEEVEQNSQAGYDLGQLGVDKLIDAQHNVLGQRLALLASKYGAWSAYADVQAAAGQPYSTQGFRIPR
ncbi:MAG TPA: TolC family protein [Burkholderiales bacterium]|nr:TolC family protein [Burkholderiales bacterium]